MKSALELARAEEWAEDNLRYLWEPESDQLCLDEANEIGAQEAAVLYAKNLDGEILDSLGCILDPDDEYARFLEANMALGIMDRMTDPAENPLGRDTRAALGAAVGGAVGGGYGAHRGGRSGGALGGAAGGAVGSFVAAHLAEITGAAKGFTSGAKEARRRELATPGDDRQRRTANRVTVKSKKKKRRKRR